MSDSDERDNAQDRRVAGVAITLTVVAALLAFSAAVSWGALNLQERERAYPIPTPECTDGAKCPEKSLQIQAREAAVAQAAVEVAVFQLALGAGSVFLIGLTAFYAHRAWVEARTSAKAAIASIEHLRTIERAYVFPEIADVKPGETPRSWKVKFSGTNSGKTPAVVDTFYFESVPPDHEFPSHPEYPDDERRHVRDSVIASGVSQEMGSPTLPDVDQIVFGYIHYRDIFGKPHTSRFRIFVRGGHFEPGKVWAEPNGSIEWNGWD